MLVGLALLLAGVAATWRFAHADGPLRAGPWPGLTPRGGKVLLGCAALLAGGQVFVDPPQQPWPDLPLLAALAFAPLALATRLTRMPGAATAVCGAYLLPRSVLSLVDPSRAPPPLLLVPALVFEVSVWLRPGDLATLINLWPGRHRAWRARDRTPRAPAGRARRAIAGGLFGLSLAASEPAFVVLLGAAPATWSGAQVPLAAAVSVSICALMAVSARGIKS